jgi:hypothetical protein
VQVFFIDFLSYDTTWIVRYSGYYDLVVHVLAEFMLEAGATKGRDLRLEVGRIRSGASRDRQEDVVWLGSRAPMSAPSSNS